jgi:hypothetical protein
MEGIGWEAGADSGVTGDMSIAVKRKALITFRALLLMCTRN